MVVSLLLSGHNQLNHPILLLQVKQTACLEVDQDVWKVKFSKFGNMIAASAAGQQSASMYIWELRPTEANPNGSWELQSKIRGGSSEGEGEQAVLEG